MPATRWAAFMYRLAGSPDYTAPEESLFADVPTDSQFYKEISWLADQQIATGWDADGQQEFRPLAPVARDAMAAFLYRFAGRPEFSAPEASPFVDVPADSQFYAEISWLAEQKISTGWTDSNGARTYRPLEDVARDAMAAFMYRLQHDPLPIQQVRISAGGRFTCAVNESGGAQCWGSDEWGQLGDGQGGSWRKWAPVDVDGLDSGVAAISASTGGSACALLDSGGVKCWGTNYGNLGDGTRIDRFTPVDVVGLDRGVAALSVGGGFACALLDFGDVKCWGYNMNGELADGTTVNVQLTPVDVVGLGRPVVALAASQYHTCAVLDTGGVKCWGYNWGNQFGGGTRGIFPPVDVDGLDHGVVGLSAGHDYTCAVLDTGGVKCWGANDRGQLGDGTTVNRWAPVDVVGLDHGVVSVTGRIEHTCALLDSGDVKCWGHNTNAQLGDGTLTDRLSPVEVDWGAGAFKAVEITAGGGHTCALLDTGEARCWGANYEGQLGIATTTKLEYHPRQVYNFRGPAS